MKKKMKQSHLSAILGIGSILLLLLVIIFSVLNELSTVATKRVNDSKHELVMMAYQLRDGSQYLTSEVRAYSANGNSMHYDNYWYEVNTNKRRDSALERMREIGLTTQEEKTIQSVLDLSNSLIPLEEQAMEAVKKGDNTTALSLMYGAEYTDGITRISSMTEDFIEMLSERATSLVDAASVQQKTLFAIMVAAICGVALFQILSIYTVRKGILRPIALICENMEHIANGDLEYAFPLEPDTSEIGTLTDAIIRTKHTLSLYINEISYLLGQMADGNLDLTIKNEYIGDFLAIKTALQKIIDDLNRTFAEISGAANGVADNAMHVSSTAQTLAQGSTEQAAAVDDLKETVTAISEHVHQSADNASQADTQASGVDGDINRCNDLMRQAIDAMAEINHSAGQIGSIIKTIDDIAFQTNILALNAAVEAARAGQAGKGFAVVADEVRNLATKSASAASDTTELIDSAIHSVQQGSDIVNEAAGVLHSIVDRAQNVVSSIQGITNAANAQAKELSDVSEGMTQIATVISTNSASAEESAAASVEFSEQAETLKRLLRHFRLRTDELPQRNILALPTSESR